MTAQPTVARPGPSPTPLERSDRRRTVLRKVIGGFYLTMGGVHLGIVAADPQLYDDVADHALFGFVRTAWAEVFMANPAAWGLVLCLAEVLIGTMLLVGGRWAMPGWALVIAFHLGLLVVFGWGILLWVVPALALVTPLAVADWRRRPS